MLQGPRFLDQRQEATCLESKDTLLTIARLTRYLRDPRHCSGCFVNSTNPHTEPKARPVTAPTEQMGTDTKMV